jgi:hypothetical protein
MSPVLFNMVCFEVDFTNVSRLFCFKTTELTGDLSMVQQIKPNLSEVEMSGKQIEKSNKNISKSSCKNNETVKDFNIRQDDGNNYHFVDSLTNLSESDKLDEVNSVKIDKFSPIIENKSKHKVTIDKSPVSSVVLKQNNQIWFNLLHLLKGVFNLIQLTFKFLA